MTVCCFFLLFLFSLLFTASFCCFFFCFLPLLIQERLRRSCRAALGAKQLKLPLSYHTFSRQYIHEPGNMAHIPVRMFSDSFRLPETWHDPFVC